MDKLQHVLLFRVTQRTQSEKGGKQWPVFATSAFLGENLCALCIERRPEKSFGMLRSQAGKRFDCLARHFFDAEFFKH